ncbi:ethylene-responsive transcription factor ERF018 [Senna tora]|uniref:Ethylene-responsive transcription factor ERF018 n=1 Tax=Senna tora TaxID=362788 RepID=A0A834U426_9FABA|nr:ethylene-responsive transcription factor ERF018 [Senna tora]
MATSDHQNHQSDLIGTSSHDDHQSCSNKYKGVRKRKWGKWVSEIRLPNSRERIWLGSYDSAEKAARAFDAALYCLRGPRAHFNFPDTPSEFDIMNLHPHSQHSLSPHQIQDLAARFANQFQPHEINDEHQQQQQLPLLPTAVDPSPSESDRVTETTDTTGTGTGYNMYDWSFLNSLDSSIDDVNFNYSNLHINDTDALYCGGIELDKMHSGELYHTPNFLMDHSDNQELVCLESISMGAWECENGGKGRN